MIPRYSRKEMANIWSEQNKYQIWLEIEAYAVEAMEQLTKTMDRFPTNREFLTKIKAVL